MTTEMKKVWFVDGAIVEQEIPESEIYAPRWSINSCKAYAKQLRDKTRANTAEHAAEAIEYLLAEREQRMQYKYGPMAFQIYLPSTPTQAVNHGKLPWVYDQDRSSGNVASMWVTPVAQLGVFQEETEK